MSRTLLGSVLLLGTLCACDSSSSHSGPDCALTVDVPAEATADAGTVLDRAFTPRGANGAVTFSLESGTLPDGLTLSSDGRLSGTSTTTGSFPLAVRATDERDCSAVSATYTLQVGCQEVILDVGEPPPPQLGQPYAHTPVASGLLGTASWTVAEGALPAGLSLGAGGAVTGTPTALGQASFTLRVTDANGCFADGAAQLTVEQIVQYPAPQSWTPTTYYTGPSVGADGWINGLNVYLDEEKAAYFEALPAGVDLIAALIQFGQAYSSDPSKLLTIRVYDGTSGAPGASLASAVVTMGQVMADVGEGRVTRIAFSAPVTLPVSRQLFVSVALTGLTYAPASTPDRDVLGMVSNGQGQTTPSAIWERQADHLWYRYTTAGSWNLSASLYVFPVLVAH